MALILFVANERTKSQKHKERHKERHAMIAESIQISSAVTYGTVLVVLVAGFLVTRTLIQWYRRRSRGRGLT